VISSKVDIFAGTFVKFPSMLGADSLYQPVGVRVTIPGRPNKRIVRGLVIVSMPTFSILSLISCVDMSIGLMNFYDAYLYVYSTGTENSYPCVHI